MRISVFISAPVLMLGLITVACTNDPGTTRQQAAKTTEELKRDSREAAGDIKKGAETARTQLSAAAQGVKEGLGDKSSSQVNLNSATKAQLMGLPGINDRRADAIIAHRPYLSPRDAVRKGAITDDEYQRIASQVSTESSSQSATNR